MIIKHLLVSLRLFVIVFMCGIGNAHAQLAAEQARIDKCPEGQYTGPREGARRFAQDPYSWFVSADFARRFCMPESMIDPALKGALAIAVRIKPSDDVSCGFLAGRSDVCREAPRFLLDIYVDNKTANIPKADKNVEFYAGKQFNSGRLITDERSKARWKGEVPDLVGERRPFSPYAGKSVSDQDWTRFQYVGVRRGWASINTHFIEDYYRANWVNGIDLITLEGDFSFGASRDPDAPQPYANDPYKDDPIQRYAIAVILAKNEAPSGNAPEANAYYKKNIPYPNGYLHTIELPHKLAQSIYAFGAKQYDSFFGDLKRATTPK